MAISQQQHPVFVYGTLRTGQPNHRLFNEGVIASINPAILRRAQMHGAGRGFPYVTDGDNEVVGELVWLTADRYQDTLRRLDRLEGYHGPAARNHYDRVQRDVATESSDGDEVLVTAWVYLAAPGIRVGAPVPTGDWVASTEAA